MQGANSYYYNNAMELFQEAYEKHVDGKLEEAIPAYQKSIDLCPTAEAHTYLGWAYSMQGRYKDAIAECRRAIEVDPDFGNPYNDIGAYLIDTGKTDEARTWLEKALHAKRYDSYCYPYYNLGRIWEGKGDWEKALECYQNSLKQNANYTLAKKAENRILALFH